MKTEGRNLAVLGSFAWRMKEDDRPWARILRHKLTRGRVLRSLNGLNRIAA